MPDKMSMIYTQICAVMNDISAVGKTQKNKNQGYSFRGIDQVYNELHSVLARHQVFTVPEVLEERSYEKTSASGSVLFYRILRIKYTFYAEDGSNVSAVVIGEGMDSGDKASNKAMAVGHKYALMQVFCIPTEDHKDPEHDDHSIIPAKEPVVRHESEPYIASPDHKMFLVHICKKHSIDNPTMMGKISARLQQEGFTLGDMALEVPKLYREISNDHK